MPIIALKGEAVERHCPQGKRPYVNGTAAHREARKLRTNNRAKDTLRPYRCSYCSQWHLANGHGKTKRNLNADKRRISKHADARRSCEDE